MHVWWDNLCKVKLHRPCNSTFGLHSHPSEQDTIVTDFLDEKRREINDRLAELKPLIAESTRLQAAAAALAGVGGTAPRAAASTPAASSATPARRGPGRPRGSKSRAT